MSRHKRRRSSRLRPRGRRGSRRANPAGRQGTVLEIEITGDVDSHALEALWLEIRRVGKRYGAGIEEFRTEGVVDDFSA